MALRVITCDRKDGSIKGEITMIAEEVSDIAPRFVYSAVANKSDIQEIQSINQKAMYDWEKECSKINKENKKNGTNLPYPDEPEEIALPEKVFHVEGYNKADFIPPLIYGYQIHTNLINELFERIDELEKEVAKLK